MKERSGPLKGIRIVELSAMGPVPFCCQQLADMGAEIIRIDRAQSAFPIELTDDPIYINGRGRRSVAVNLKHPEGVAVVLDLVAQADVLVEGFRPGVTERLGLGPDECLARNSRLIYGRCSGWGRTGPLAHTAAHDLSYIALAGVLSMLGDPDQPPPPPLGLVADQAGGAMFLAVGILAALVERSQSGAGQVVDNSALDGALALSTLYHDSLASGGLTNERGSYIADGSAPFYRSYQTSDDRYVAVSAVEPEFYDKLLVIMQLDKANLPAQSDRSSWPAMKQIFAERFRTATRDEWAARAEGTDACLTPVLTLSEVPCHPHNIARNSFVEIGGQIQPAPVPLFSRTMPGTPSARPERGADTITVLTDWGIGGERIASLIASGAITQN